MSAVSKSRARLVYDRAGGACEYCGRGLRRHEATVDHWMPRWREGDDALENLRLACNPCNQAKGNLHPDDWAPLAAHRRAVREAVERARGERRATRVELLQRCAPCWRGRVGTGDVDRESEHG